MSNKSGSSDDIISVPDGGGAISGMGETFSPDLFTGTGNFSVPISVPDGRGGLSPELTLGYSTGQGNGPFGMGWSLSVPGVTRKTSKGVPTYRRTDLTDGSGTVTEADVAEDVFVLSGAEDLVRVERRIEGSTTIDTYRPRTEGLYARIEHHRPDGDSSWWEVRTKSGNISYYGTPAAERSGRDPATVCDPESVDAAQGDYSKVDTFAWRLTRTEDPFGNRIVYDYERVTDQDVAEPGPDPWEQLYLSRIRYLDYGDPADPDFLLRVELEWEDRPDSFSGFRQGFEVRTTRRCASVKVYSDAVENTRPLIRTYDFTYRPQANELLNGLSVLESVQVTGHNDAGDQSLPPITFDYTDFDPEGRRFETFDGPELPRQSLGSATLETVDLFGNGLPDLVEMSGQTIRYWQNRGNGEFDWPRPMHQAPAGLSLADEGVQFLDAEGNGRADLLVSRPDFSGYFPLTFEGTWDEDSFQPYKVFPSVGLGDPNTRLMDLTGDGLSDILRTGASSFECYFNDRDPDRAWTDTARVAKGELDDFPNVNLSSPSVRTADMTGDGLQDIVLIHDRRVDWWPNLGYGRFGRRRTMNPSPSLPGYYRPEQILVGDVDGDGLADLVLVEDGCVRVWMNQAGNGFADPVAIQGTPRMADPDGVRLMDLKGTGTPGILWAQGQLGPGRAAMYFLDLTGGNKPYMLREMDNNMGAVTRVAYEPSTVTYIDDQWNEATRWKTPLPFPAQTVSRVEVIDEVSGGKMTTEYSYHHGYWDGHEREFRGFARVEQTDSETFVDYESEGLFPDTTFESVDQDSFSEPVTIKHWFMLGGVTDAAGAWSVPDFTDEWWQHPDTAGHPNKLLGDWAYAGDDTETGKEGWTLEQKLDAMAFDRRREALRALRGRKLRTETYSTEGPTARQVRPYTVTEQIHSLRTDGEGPAGTETRGILFPYGLATRTTQWDRGDDPMTRFEWSRSHTAYGQPTETLTVACPRGWQRPDASMSYAGAEPDRLELFLTTYGTTDQIHVDQPGQYMVDRVAESESWEVTDPGGLTLTQLKSAVDQSDWTTAPRTVQSHTRNYYDGNGFEGLTLGQIGTYGAMVRAEQLVLTDDIVDQAYPSGATAPDDTGPPVYLESDSPTWTAEYPQAFRDRIDGLGDRAGYIVESGRFYVESDRATYDFQDGATTPRGLPAAQKNKADHLTTIDYDTYDARPIQVTDTLDGVDHVTEATYDYQAFKPSTVTDVNDNRTRVAYTPLGLAEKVARQGKATETKGDTLATPGQMLTYDLTYGGPTDPVSVTTTAREYHVHDDEVPGWADGNATIETVEYSDGFGRVVQTRTQAEERDYGDAGLPTDYGQSIDDAVPTTDTDRVRVSGWTRFNNKGEAVETWEPFFASGQGFGDLTDARAGESVQTRYDARGRPVRTIRPDGGESWMVHGVPGTLASPDISTPETFEPTPWEVYTYDANDNGGRTTIANVDQTAFSDHFDTPTSAVVDALGRTVTTTERKTTSASDEVVTETVYDIRGNVLEVIDPLGRSAVTQTFDLADRKLRNESIDAGDSIAVFDGAGVPVEARDAKGGLVLTGADALLRPTHSWGRDESGADVRLVGRTIFGHIDAPQADPKASNHLGKPFKQYDEAGVSTAFDYDFKGNLLERTQATLNPQLMIDAVEAADSQNNWVVDTYRVDWTPAAGETLGDREAALTADPNSYRTAYKTARTFDGLDRPKKIKLPVDDDDTHPDDAELGKEILPQFNRAGALQAVEMTGTGTTPSVSHIAYNARGQRILAALGNGVMTRYAYDPKTFRLARQRSETYTETSGTYTSTAGSSGTKYEDTVYAYDAVGNILETDERVDKIGVGGTGQLVRDFDYDGLYRLVSATGREASLEKTAPWKDHLQAVSDQGYTQTPQNTRTYTETYDYDDVGNLNTLTHAYGTGSDQWVRDYTTESGSNRISGMDVGASSYTYSHDAAGNMAQENTARHFEWDQAGRMRAFRNQVTGSEATVFAHYNYDGDGQRVQKVATRGAKTTRTVYIEGVFEHRQVLESDAITNENQTLHLMDDASRVATHRVGPRLNGTDPAGEATQYYLSDHLQSSVAVVLDNQTLHSREQYRPYGETAYGSFAYKRYRFTGKEKDEESGLHYHGARYYAPWLAKWTTTDPLGFVASLNLFSFANDNPTRFNDPTGERPPDQVNAQGIEPTSTSQAIPNASSQVDAHRSTAGLHKRIYGQTPRRKWSASNKSASNRAGPLTLADVAKQSSNDDFADAGLETEDLTHIELRPTTGRPRHSRTDNNIYLSSSLYNKLEQGASTSELSIDESREFFEEVRHAGQYDNWFEREFGKEISKKGRNEYNQWVRKNLTQNVRGAVDDAMEREFDAKVYAGMKATRGVGFATWSFERRLESAHTYAFVNTRANKRPGSVYLQQYTATVQRIQGQFSNATQGRAMAKWLTERAEQVAQPTTKAQQLLHRAIRMGQSGQNPRP